MTNIKSASELVEYKTKELIESFIKEQSDVVFNLCYEMFNASEDGIDQESMNTTVNFIGHRIWKQAAKIMEAQS